MITEILFPNLATIPQKQIVFKTQQKQKFKTIQNKKLISEQFCFHYPIPCAVAANISRRQSRAEAASLVNRNGCSALVRSFLWKSGEKWIRRRVASCSCVIFQDFGQCLWRIWTLLKIYKEIRYFWDSRNAYLIRASVPGPSWRIQVEIICLGMGQSCVSQKGVWKWIHIMMIENN